MKLEIFVSRDPECSGNHGAAYVNSAGQVKVEHIRNDRLLGKFDPYEILDAAAADERCGMIRPGPNCKVIFADLVNRSYIESNDPSKVLAQSDVKRTPLHPCLSPMSEHRWRF